MDKDAVKRLLADNGLTPNRSLGQNFLIDGSVISRILEGARIDGLPVLEVGPGLGALTEGLMARASHVTAVEKDRALAEILKKRLPDPKLTVETADFLDFDAGAAMGSAPYEAVGNLPYYVTTPLSEKLLCLSAASVTLMVQAEAADRFTAMPGERVYGPLAVISQAFYRVETLLDVPAEAFYPAPEVQSRVVRLVRKDRADGAEPGKVLRFLKRAFAMRRKTLRNVLLRPNGFDGLLKELGLPEGVRAEAIDPETLMNLYLIMEKEAAT